jgi:hypothetical protein
MVGDLEGWFGSEIKIRGLRRMQNLRADNHREGGVPQIYSVTPELLNS